jgi:WD40 repeat protein
MAPQGWKFPARLQLWNMDKGQRLAELQGHRVQVASAAFSLDGRQIISCGADGHICRWEAASGRRLSEQLGAQGLSHANLLFNGQFLVLRRFGNGVMIDRCDTLDRQSEFSVPTRSIGDLHASVQGKRIIAGTEEGAVYVWNAVND